MATTLHQDPRRRPLWRYTFGSAVMLGSAAASALALHAVSPFTPLSGFAAQAMLVGALVVAGVVYWAWPTRGAWLNRAHACCSVVRRPGSPPPCW